MTHHGHGLSAESCAICGRCDNYYLLDADSSVYPYDFHVLDEWKLGNIQQDSFFRLKKSETGRRFCDLSPQVDENYRHCPRFALCRREGEPLQGDTQQLNRLCQDHRMFLDQYGDRLRRMAADLQHANGVKGTNTKNRH